METLLITPSKRKLKFNQRMQTYKKLRLTNPKMSQYRCAIEAGYPHATAWNAYQNIESRCNFKEMMVKQGLDDESILGTIKEGVGVRSASSGQPTLVTKAFTELALKVGGRLKDESKEHISFNKIEIIVINEDPTKEQREDNPDHCIDVEASSMLPKQS